jgi:hypothetical protein
MVVPTPDCLIRGIQVQADPASCAVTCGLLASSNKTVSGREKTKAQSRVPVTALIAWPGFHSARAEPQGAKQIAAPAEPRTPNLHRANQSLLESANGSMATVATRREEKNLVQRKNKRTDLTPTGLLMEGDFTSLRFWFAFLKVNKRNQECLLKISVYDTLFIPSGLLVSRLFSFFRPGLCSCDLRGWLTAQESHQPLLHSGWNERAGKCKRPGLLVGYLGHLRASSQSAKRGHF